MKMRDWELIANVHGERWRELKWIEAYMLEKGCDRVFVEKILSFPDFKFSEFGTYVSTLFDNAKSDEECNRLSDNVIDMQEQLVPCSIEFNHLLNLPIVKLVNSLAVLNWKIFIKPRFHFTLWGQDNKEGDRAWIAGQRTLSYWLLNSKHEPCQRLWAIHVSWTIPSWYSLALALNVGGIENVATLHIGLLLFRVFLQLEEVPRFFSRWIPETERELSFKIHNNIIWIYLFADVDCWRNGDWRRIVIHPIELLLGQDRCTTEQIEEKPVDICFDNRIYKAKAKLEIRTWRRSRLPFLKRSRKDVGLEIEGGIPIPGKGENSYDIDEDALMGTGASTFDLNTSWDALTAEAIDNVISSVQRTRLRYGGAGWESFAQKVARETGLEVIDS